MTSLELRQLEYFVAVAEHLHFGRAADALSIGQPAVSQQVARLERILGTELLDRTPRAVRLTEPGLRFLPEARAALAAVDRARDSVIRQRAASPLRLGTCSGMGERLEAILWELEKRVPARGTALVSVSTRSRLERVAAGQLDAAFVRGVVSAPGVELVELWEDELVAAVPAGHPLAEHDRVDLAELARLPVRLVSRRTNPPLVDLVLSQCARVGRQPHRLDFDDGPIDTLLAAVASGPPSWSVVHASQARMFRTPRLAFRPTDPALRLTTRLAVRESMDSRDAAPLIEACLAAAGQHPSREES